jgi:hypothetical protein
LLYCRKSEQQGVREALAAENVNEMAFTFDMQGAQVIVNDPFIDGDQKSGSRWVFVPAAAAMSSGR